MAEETDFYTSEIEKFKKCNHKLSKLVYRDTEDFKEDLGILLDEFNSVEYSLKVTNEEVASQCLSRCVYLVPIHQELMVTKVCQLIVNLVSRQQLILEGNLEIIVEYVVKVLTTCQPWTHGDALRALGALVYENCGRISKFHEEFVGSAGLLLRLAESADEETQRGAVQCIENICTRTSPTEYLDEGQQLRCFGLFLHVLHTQKPARMDEVNHCRVLITALRGIQNIILAARSSPSDHLGELLAAIKIYMLHGLGGGLAVNIPSCLYPTPLSQYDQNPVRGTKTPASGSKDEEVSLRPTPTKNMTKGSAKKSKRKRANKQRPKESNDEDSFHSGIDRLSLTTAGLGTGSSQQEVLSSSGGEVLSSSGGEVLSSSGGASALLPSWIRVSSSESEYSDTEGGNASKLRAYNSKVRQCALGCFHAVIKVTEKRVMFGYWTSFLPDTTGFGGPPHGQTLFTAIMKDPSPKARAGALAVLTAMVEGSKSFLMAAEDSDPSRGAFTPFSFTIASMVKEIHRCLLLAVMSETSPLALTQIIKCLATMIPNVPYQRLKPGLLSRVVKQIKPFLAHRDPNIRVACLTCMGSVVSVQSPLVEVWQLLQASKARHTSIPSDVSARDAPDSGYHSNQGGNASASSSDSMVEGQFLSSGMVTPNLPSGCLTPSLSDIQSQASEASWVVRMCVKNVAPALLDQGEVGGEKSPRRPPASRGVADAQPLPVRLESLQLMAQVTKGYFPIISPCLSLVFDLVHFCLDDEDPSVQLHGAKLLEEVGSLLLQKLQEPSAAAGPVDVAQVVELWVRLLVGPIPRVLQDVSNHAVKSTTCDCLANIGPQVFQQLPPDKNILCITLLLGLTSDDDHRVRAASVRALGVYVLYPCLREDVSFVADVANTIITALEETNLSVKVKAAWALGNLSDALVLNKDTNDTAFMDDFSDMLLLKLFEIAVKGSQDNDKVKSNAVRALGNFLRYLPLRSYKNSRFSHAVTNGIQALVKNVGSGTMKVRWNACYATSNMFKNSLLPLGTAPWTEQILRALALVARDCKNFKVRINAAMAFSIPNRRECYGTTEQYLEIWDSLIVSLQGTQSVVDFSEYKYKDNLLEQICATLLHLVLVVKVDDLDLLSNILSSQFDQMEAHLQKYHQIRQSKMRVEGAAVQSERQGQMAEVLGQPKVKVIADYLEELGKDQLNDQQSHGLNCLQHLFVHTVRGKDPCSPQHAQASFKQTYD